MEITEIRIKLMEASEDRLRGFCSITIENAFVIRDLKIIDGSNGPFVAMPSRKLSGNCQRCRHKNHLRSNYCNHCGTKLQQDESGYAAPQKLYADVAHPINSECREEIQQAVLAELEAELARCEQPGYRSRYDDEFDTDEAEPRSSTRSQHQPERRTKTTSEQSADENTGVNTDESESREANEKTETSVTTKANPPQPLETSANSTTVAATPEPKYSDTEPQTTKRIDSQPSVAVPTPLSSKNPAPETRETTNTSTPHGEDNFGAGIF